MKFMGKPNLNNTPFSNWTRGAANYARNHRIFADGGYTNSEDEYTSSEDEDNYMGDTRRNVGPIDELGALIGAGLGAARNYVGDKLRRVKEELIGNGQDIPEGEGRMGDEYRKYGILGHEFGIKLKRRPRTEIPENAGFWGPLPPEVIEYEAQFKKPKSKPKSSSSNGTQSSKKQSKTKPKPKASQYVSNTGN